MKSAVSAGGIVAKVQRGQLFVLLVTTKRGRLSFPKGHVEAGESLEQTTLREVREEIGLHSVKILHKLGSIQRQGTEHDGTPSQKEIVLFMVDGEKYTYHHEENYVWVEFETAVNMMDHIEEKEFLLRHHKTILAYSSAYFSALVPVENHDSYSWLADALSSDITLAERAVKYIHRGDVVVVADLPSEAEYRLLAGQSTSLLCLAPPIWKNDLTVSKPPYKVTNQFNLAPHSIDNIIDQDLPQGLSLLYAHLSLNLSDTKIFFLINQIIKKMRLGGYILIEGRTEEDYTAIAGTVIGPHIVEYNHCYIRIWTEEFIQQNLIERLRLSLVSLEHNYMEWEGKRLASIQLILQKQKAQGY